MMENKHRLTRCAMLCLLLLGMTGWASTAWAQNITVKGLVVDTTDEPIIGASVQVVGQSSLGAATNLDGEFVINGVPQNATLRVSYVGSKTQDVPVNGRTYIKITLLDDTELLEEVVVVGYGTQKRENLTGAVASVDVGKTIESRPIADIGHALQGVTPGLTVTSSSGQLGNGPAIKLRGSSGSLNASRGTTPLILVDNVPIPDLTFVNPNDIESISVLKDAASSSIYGTRAAFGVILITTKRGKKGDAPRVNFSSNFAWNTPTVMPKLAPAADNAQMLLDIASRYGNTEVSTIGFNIDATAVEKMREWKDKYGHMSQEELGEMKLGRDLEQRNGKWYFYREFDPIDMFMKDWSPQQKHDLSISGGSGNTNYNLGMGYLTQEGPLRFNADTNRRFTFNPSINTRINDYISLRGNVMYTNATYERPYRYSSGTYDMWYYLLRWPSFYPYADYDGKPFRSAITEVQQANMETTQRHYIRVNAGATITPIKNLDINFDYTFGMLNYYLKRRGGQVWGRDIFNTNNPIHYTSLYSSSHNRAFEQSNYAMSHTYKAYGTYNLALEEGHDFKFMAGFDAESNEGYGHTSDRKELISFIKPEIALAIGDQYVDDGPYHNQSATAGFFGRINYNYLGKYLVEFNARYDASSKFPPGKRWGFFPSGSIGWRVSEESFFEGLKPTFSDLKLRASFGSVGNQDVAANAYLSTMGMGTTSWLIDGKQLPYFGMPNAISPILTWERVTTYNLGLDTRFFNNKLGLTMEVYRRITSGMHSPGETLPSTFGQTAPKVNEGELTANGFELMMDFHHDFENGLGITASATFSTVKETITKYKNDTKNIYGYYEGKVLGEIWGYTTDRLFTEDDFMDGTDSKGNPIKVINPKKAASQSLFETGTFKYGPGDVKFVDLDGNGKIDYGSNTIDDHGDLTRIGNTRPNFEYGFSLGANYKGFDINAFFQGVGKRNMWLLGSVGTPGFGYEAIFEHQLDYWTPDNRDAFYPRPANNNWVTHGQNMLRQTRYLLNLGYLRMKNLTVGYSVPQQLLSQVGLQRARIYMSGENLFEIYDNKIPVDPETYDTGNVNGARAFPFSRTISVGAQITF
ncbi:MAG: TonB-dependent receptor [Porphyromonas sp.]|nr:TonB-dependent receptor [Porphyromonas sp.]